MMRTPKTGSHRNRPAAKPASTNTSDIGLSATRAHIGSTLRDRGPKSAPAFVPKARIPDAPGTGRPLDPDTRGFFQARFGQDFGGVRVHTDARAAAGARALSARAYTVGPNIMFAEGEYRPQSRIGRRLLAHELTHVTQQARHADAVQLRSAVSNPLDPSEREADLASNAVAAGGSFAVREAPSARIARDGPAPSSGVRVAPKPPAFNMFEEPSAATAAGAPAAFDAYLKLGSGDKEKARSWSYGTGNLQKALAALGPVNAADPKYADAVHGILRWIEETETRKTTGKTDDEMAKTQAGFIKAKAASPPGWGGTTTTRWAGLLGPAQTAWTDRGNKAIDAMVAYATAHAPELKLTKASFELEFDAVDRISLGALATGGSKPGETVQVGFEFVVTVEVDPAYALSTVVHELHGHPIYDEKTGAPNYAGKLYKAAAAKVPAAVSIDRSGEESFNYWPSEIYSLLKEIPYWTAVTAADKKKTLALPTGTTTADTLNYDPRGMIETWLKDIKSNWEPSLVNGLVRGFYKRIAADPGMKKVSVTEFEKIVKKVFAAADAAIILK
jgi:Domain of unknown function (DUF4157)